MKAQDSPLPAPGSKRDETGATATEYSILLSFIVVVLIAGATLYGLAIQDFFTWAAQYLKSILP